MSKYLSKMKKTDKISLLVGIIMIISEIIKQLVLTFIVNGGVYALWYFPFQLCSLPMYLLPLYAICRSKKVKEAILTFLMTYTLVGGIAVFFDQSGLHYTLPILTLHSYLWHIFLIVIGINSGLIFIKCQRSRKSSFRPFIQASTIYLISCLIAEIINLSLDDFGNINMFYINPDFKMAQIVFKDLVPVIGNDLTIVVYILATILGAFLFYLAWRSIERCLIKRTNFG